MPSFRAKARAADLLGKGQIADLPTAITELWKNGYDAYADSLNASLYLSGYKDVDNPFFVLSDNGKGMSKEDLLGKWLILGTDNKTRDNQTDVFGEETLWKESRIKMGEKGIGRLSVAFIGSPMLMITKRIGEPTQLVYFDWRILENYNLFLEDIEIPMASIQSKDDFYNIFDNLKQQLKTNILKDDNVLKEVWKEQKLLADDILNASDNNISFPSLFIEEIIAPLIGNDDKTHGTTFVIFEPHQHLLYLNEALKNENQKDDEKIDDVVELRRSLVGLFNVFKGENLSCSTSFMIKDKTSDFDLIASSSFFTPDDFENCDHLIEGKFNEKGKFVGKVRVFSEWKEFDFKPNRLIKNTTSYGAFSIKLGYVAGRNQSLLEDTIFKSFDTRLKDYGGLYIYRDDFRVLPYGKIDYDFLKFEARRNLRAGSYFFSHRRMFGYIDIDRKYNKNLQDKAGREGFVNNIAYRDFKTDLESFFINLAKTFFGTDALDSSKNRLIEEKKKQIEAEKKEKERDQEERRRLNALLEKTPGKIENLEKEYLQLLEELRSKIEIQYDYHTIENIINKLSRLEHTLKNSKVKPSNRTSITNIQKKKIQDIENQIDKIINVSILKGDNLMALARLKLQEQDKIKAFDRSYTQYKSLIKETVDNRKTIIEKTIKVLENDLLAYQNEALLELETEYNANRLLITTHNQDVFENLKNFFNDKNEEINDKLEPLTNHIEKLSLEYDDEFLIGYYKEKYSEVSQQLRQSYSLAQLGMAVEIIDHQFFSLYAQLSQAIKVFESQFLKEENKQEIEKFSQIKNAFEHLEKNYELVSPLYRVNNSKIQENIRGDYFVKYLNDFFEKTIQNKNIIISGTENFNKNSIRTYKSVILPVLINVVNNAIYWLNSVENRKIEFAYEDDKFIIRNSGLPIEDDLLDKIFDLFYSKRPRGRGIGLYLSRLSLREIGYDIIATNDKKYNTLNGACFIIQPFKDNTI